VKSKFKYGAYILAILAIAFSMMLSFMLSMYFWLPIPIAFYIIVNLFCIFSWIWLIFGELRTKVIRVDIGYDNFMVRGYFGFGASKTLYFNEIEGYKIAVLPAQGTSYEYLYVMAGNKKAIKLSEFYHKNYTELKEGISSAKIKYLGFEDFSYAKELKEIFI